MSYSTMAMAYMNQRIIRRNKGEGIAISGNVQIVHSFQEIFMDIQVSFDENSSLKNKFRNNNRLNAKENLLKDWPLN